MNNSMKFLNRHRRQNTQTCLITLDDAQNKYLKWEKSNQIDTLRRLNQS